MSYNVKLEIFEGPLDLLLFFIQRDEINIYDIPISAITKEYLEYIEIMHQMKLAIAGEFLEVAAMLMRIKVKILLPDIENPGEEIEDPRTELVDMLLEYKKYKLVAARLREQEKTQSKYTKAVTYKVETSESAEIDLAELSIMDIGLIFRKILKNIPEQKNYEIKRIKITITQQIQFVKKKLQDNKTLNFKALTKNIKTKIEIIATFLAILEMIKNGLIKIIQEQESQELWISKV